MVGGQGRGSRGAESVQYGGDDSGYGGAVAVRVHHALARVDGVEALGDVRREVAVAQIDPGVDHRHRGPQPHGALPGRVGLEAAYAPGDLIREDFRGRRASRFFVVRQPSTQPVLEDRERSRLGA